MTLKQILFHGADEAIWDAVLDGMANSLVSHRLGIVPRTLTEIAFEKFMNTEILEEEKQWQK